MTGRIVIAGGSGFLGRVLAAHYRGLGIDVVVLSRSGRDGAVRWDGRRLGPWAEHVDGAAAVINLAGRSVDCRYGSANRLAIYESRLNSTRVIGQAIAASKNPPPVWINASTATIYRHAEDRPMDEATGEIGSGFSVNVARAWEAMLAAAPTPHTRKVALRMAMVLGREGGVFPVFRRLARLGLAGTIGPGTQYISWFHESDLARAVDWILEHDELKGAVNLAAPHPVRTDEFLRSVRRVHGARFGLPTPSWLVEIGCFVLRTESELVLKSRRVIPGRLSESGFTFRHPRLDGALEDLAGRPAREPDSARRSELLGSSY